jgi:hypothetical protein
MLSKILLICIFIISIESRRSLRDYVVSQNNINGLVTNSYSVYDPLKNDLLCRLESLNNIFNPSSYLILYPSQQTIGSEGFRFTIKYGEKYYSMENKINSLITEIRDAKKANYILTRFYQTYFNLLFGS